jgi:carboxyl-terminal processing protease
LKLREKDDPDALPWDEIKNAPIKSWVSGYDISVLKKISEARINSNEAFRLIKENTEWLAKQNDKEYSLNIDKFRKEQKAILATIRQNDSLRRLKD